MNVSQALKNHSGAIALDKLIPRRGRGIFRMTLVFLVVSSVIYGITANIFKLPLAEASIGLSFMLGSVLGVMWLLEAYYNTYYFFGLNSIIGIDNRKVTGCSYEVAKVLHDNPDDITLSFLQSAAGREVLLRIGIDRLEVDAYLADTRTPIFSESVSIDNKIIVHLETIGLLMLQRDSSFEQFLNERGVLNEHFLGALRWVSGRMLTTKRRQRWWSKDNLSKRPSLGREWVFGRTYHLQQFAKDMNSSTVFSGVGQNTAYAKEKVEEIEATLARALSANVLLVGQAGVGKMDLLVEVSRRMLTGEALQAIIGQHIVVLDTARLFAVYDNKRDIEAALLGLFSEAQAAGNTIVVIENISTFITETASVGIHVTELLDRFLAADDLHVVATDVPKAYHTHLEPMRAFTRRFQEVLIETPSLESTVNVLLSVVDTHERSSEALFTYQSLIALATSADRYVVNGVMPDKAVQLLADVHADCAGDSISLIREEDIYRVVSKKTGIPVGPIKESERDILLNLEDVLHKKIIGQNNAIEAISKTMRRARAGVQTSDRPIGSFLFLGPTGVGKTETAKALASVFFSDESAMSRIDMSEYSDEESLSRLLGTTEVAGTLPSLLQEHPYGVLLLDEFEKAAVSVHDLFLQVLDEGIFTDGRGNTVNARNTIIIATSNAGGALIINTIQHRQSISVLDSEIINHIINAGIFKPELINRFDAAIIFEPLDEEEQGSVAQLLLSELIERIRSRGYTLEITQKLTKALVHKGYSPEFGARPMRRLMQDLVEEKIAQKIIDGSLTKGSTIMLDVSDFAPEEFVVEESTN